MFMKLAAREYSASNNIPDSVVCKLYRIASGDAEDWLAAIQATYAMELLGVIVEFLKEMGRVEWQHHDPDLAAEAAIRLRERFRRLRSSPKKRRSGSRRLHTSANWPLPEFSIFRDAQLGRLKRHHRKKRGPHGLPPIRPADHNQLVTGVGNG
ncbi:hypothetical protein DF133_35830 [Burkholderia cenocepacia]|nr:hypothetical protein DF133_35830 [Burkholderia cenocepacia]